MNVLLPYLLGAASAFAVQFLIEIYVVPRVDTRKRREERWEKDVLDFGELLSTSVQELAGKARGAQWMVQLVSSGQLKPDYSDDQLDAYLAELRRDSQQATREFTELMSVRPDWIADRIIEFRANSDQIAEFGLAWRRYRLNLLNIEATKYGEVPESDFEAYWDSERTLRTGLLSQVKALGRLRHPPRSSWRTQVRYLRRSIAARIKRNPVPTKPVRAGSGRH